MVKVGSFYQVLLIVFPLYQTSLNVPFIKNISSLLQININEYNLKATGVNFFYRGKNYTINVRHDVILAAGPIETPKLLMLSGIGKPEHLAALNVIS